MLVSRGRERAGAVAKTLEERGFRYVSSLMGVVVAWRQLGLSTVREHAIVQRRGVLREIGARVGSVEARARAGRHFTLRAVGGLGTAEIAAAFLVPEATMAQRISRAKQTIKNAGQRFHAPSASEREARLDAVLHVLYLVFNEGYVSSSGAGLQRADLSSEAIRLARAVYHLVPNDGEVAGLLALMLLTDARRHARSGPDGELIPLDEQDRALWDRAAIDEGVALVSATLSRGAVGAHQLQAAIAAVHSEAAHADETDWPQILALYGLLKRMSDNPMVTLSHAIAAAMVQGPVAGLELLRALDGDPRLSNHHRLSAVRAHLFERAGDREEAIRHYRAAASRATSTPERNYLLVKAARLSERSAHARDAGERNPDRKLRPRNRGETPAAFVRVPSSTARS